jgi:hypothetical protein
MVGRTEECTASMHQLLPTPARPAHQNAPHSSSSITGVKGSCPDSTQMMQTAIPAFVDHNRAMHKLCVAFVHHMISSRDKPAGRRICNNSGTKGECQLPRQTVQTMPGLCTNLQAAKGFRVQLVHLLIILQPGE